MLDEAGFGRRIVPVPKAFAIAALKTAEFLKLSPIYQWVYETAGKDSSVSIERARLELGFRPRFSNIDALITNFAWYKKNRNRIEGGAGTSHRTAWRQGALGLIKHLF